MTLFNLNHFWIRQAEFCLKGTFVKAYIMFVSIFLDIYENPRRKDFINSSCPKHPEIINWNKKWHEFLFSHFFVVPLKKVSSSWGSEKNCALTETTRVEAVFLSTYAISVSVTVEIHENNIDTSRVTHTQDCCI